jgi:hypothetical protein
VDVATPLALVVSVSVAFPLAKVPLATGVPPLAGIGAVNVTTAPLIGLLPLSVTVATSGAANAALIAALCPLPLVAAILAGEPVVFVRVKAAPVNTPEIVAVTV